MLGTALDIILVCEGQLSIYAFSSLLAARAQAAATRHPWVWALGRIQATPAPGPPQDSKVQGSNFDIDTGVKTYLENVGFSAFFLLKVPSPLHTSAFNLKITIKVAT